MISLWIPFALLTLVAMAFVAIPLLRSGSAKAVQDGVVVRREKNREVFLQRQVELAGELEQGVVSNEDHKRMLAELQRAFMRDMESLDQQTTLQRVSGKPALLVLVGLIPVCSFWLYWQHGSVNDLVLPEIVESVRQAPDEASQLAALNRLADQLQARFGRHQTDLQNGYMLGTLYLELERYGDAADVLRIMLQDMEDTPDRAAVLGQLAQAEYMGNGSKVNDAVQAIIDEALKLNPNEFAVMSILAIDAFLKEDLPSALGYWRRQLSVSDPGSQQAATLRERIATIEAYLPDDQKAAATGTTITLMVDISDELRAQAETGFAGMFVYVRSAAMAMPIVAQNLAIQDFPFTITLDNSMSMTGMQLESVPQLIAGARLSKTGVANRAAGDLQTESAPFELSALEGPLTLVIDQIVP